MRTQAEVAAEVSSYFDNWYTPLVRYALRATGSLSLAEDLVQEAFLKLYRRLREGMRIEKPKAWIMCVLRHDIGKLMHSQSTERNLHEPLDVLDGVPAGWTYQEQTATEFAGVSRFFSKLTRREEEVTLLRLAGLKHREIAEQLGMSPNSVGTLLARALRKLQMAVRREEVVTHPVSDNVGQDVSTLQ